MTTQDLTVLNAAISKMHWNEARQKVLSQNIANAELCAKRYKAIGFQRIA